MLSYHDFPPLPNFLKVLKQMPECALVYAEIFSECDERNHLTVSKEDIRNHFHISSTIFKNHCIRLSEEGFMFFSETNKYYILDAIK